MRAISLQPSLVQRYVAQKTHIDLLLTHGWRQDFTVCRNARLSYGRTARAALRCATTPASNAARTTPSSSSSASAQEEEKETADDASSASSPPNARSSSAPLRTT